MKVYELIQELSQYKADTEVEFHVKATFDTDVEAEFDSRITEEKKMLEEMPKQCEMLKVVGYYDDVRSLGR